MIAAASTYDYHFRKGCLAAGLVGSQGRPKYTPRTLRDFFASTALANGIPIHEVSRWFGHRSIKVTVDIYGHLVPPAWSRCREILQSAMRPVPRACRRKTMLHVVLDVLNEARRCWIGAG
ncbi:tyrosine-type recombinase/integrase [Streptomyces sp. ISL-100]|uniref:tyrosine-type recombinase/integrase n=1 Tax=Streptomyces sp. ISL-100 TaxID=2819173 RepID=UPI0020362DD3|nr:tyrosine-type recombinase/integrase [Streptomyces sp. ISL-100]